MKSALKGTVTAAIILMAGMISCEEADLTFDQGNAFVAFKDAGGTLTENARDPIAFEIYYASLSTGDVSVTLEFDAEGIDNPAVEGVDFRVVSGKNLSFASGLVQVAEIEAIDNDLRDMNKSVRVKLAVDGPTPVGKGAGVNGTYLLTILDNEHPLARWIGTYSVDADSYGDVLNGDPEGAWDEAWEVTTSPVEDDETKLSMVGIAYGDVPVIATVDQEAMTITFPAGANTGEAYGYGPAVLWRGDYVNVEQADVVGILHEDGSMEVDLLTLVLPDYGNYVWDSFNTTWTPTWKKGARERPPMAGKMSQR